MLVIAANWSISDGTLVGANGHRPWQTLVAEVRRIALRSGFRRDGAYRPVEQVDIVLAGDTFDWLLSREWLGWCDSRDAGCMCRWPTATFGRWWAAVSRCR